MINIQFSSIVIESVDCKRAIVITPSEYKGQQDFRVIQYIKEGDGLIFNEVKFYHQTVEQAINYHDYFLSNVKASFDHPSKSQA